MDSNTIRVKVIDREGVQHDLEAPTDMSMNLMEVCKSYDLPVAGTCGGMALCASCQVYVHSDHEIQEKSEDEEFMLDEAFNVKENSRLGCQIHMHNNLNNLEVELAPEE